MSSETPATPLDPPPVYRVRIGEMPETDRPRERLHAKGADIKVLSMDIDTRTVTEIDSDVAVDSPRWSWAELAEVDLGEAMAFYCGVLGAKPHQRSNFQIEDARNGVAIFQSIVLEDFLFALTVPSNFMPMPPTDQLRGAHGFRDARRIAGCIQRGIPAAGFEALQGAAPQAQHRHLAGASLGPEFLEGRHVIQIDQAKRDGARFQQSARIPARGFAHRRLIENHGIRLRGGVDAAQGRRDRWIGGTCRSLDVPGPGRRRLAGVVNLALGIQPAIDWLRLGEERGHQRGGYWKEESDGGTEHRKANGFKVSMITREPAAVASKGSAKPL